MTVDPTRSGYKAPRTRDFYQRLLAATEPHAGRRSASLASITPLSGSRWNDDFTVEGHAGSRRTKEVCGYERGGTALLRNHGHPGARRARVPRRRQSGDHDADPPRQRGNSGSARDRPPVRRSSTRASRSACSRIGARSGGTSVPGREIRPGARLRDRRRGRRCALFRAAREDGADGLPARLEGAGPARALS